MCLHFLYRVPTSKFSTSVLDMGPSDRNLGHDGGNTCPSFYSGNFCLVFKSSYNRLEPYSLGEFACLLGLKYLLV